MALTVNDYIDHFLKDERSSEAMRRRISHFREDIGDLGGDKVGPIGAIIVSRTRVTGMSRGSMLKHIITLESWIMYSRGKASHMTSADGVTKVILYDHKVQVGDEHPITIKRVVVGIPARRSSITWLCESDPHEARIEELSALRATASSREQVATASSSVAVKDTSGSSASRDVDTVYSRVGPGSRRAYTPRASQPKRSPVPPKKHEKHEKKKGHQHGKRTGDNPSASRDRDSLVAEHVAASVAVSTPRAPRERMYTSSPRGRAAMVHAMREPVAVSTLSAPRERVFRTEHRGRAALAHALASPVSAPAAETVKDGIDGVRSSIDDMLDSDMANRIREMFSNTMKYHMSGGSVKYTPGDLPHHGSAFISGDVDKVKRFVAESIHAGGKYAGVSFTGQKPSMDPSAEYFGHFEQEREKRDVVSYDDRVMYSMAFTTDAALMVTSFINVVTDGMDSMKMMYVDDIQTLDAQERNDKYQRQATQLGLDLAKSIFKAHPFVPSNRDRFNSLMYVGMWIARTAWGGIRRSMGDAEYPGNSVNVKSPQRNVAAGWAVSEVRRYIITDYDATARAIMNGGDTHDGSPDTSYFEETIEGMVNRPPSNFILRSMGILLMSPSLGGMYRYAEDNTFALNANVAGVMCIFGINVALMAANGLGGHAIDIFKKFIGDMGEEPLYVGPKGTLVTEDELLYPKKKKGVIKKLFGDQRPVATGECACASTGDDSDSDSGSHGESASGTLPRFEDDTQAESAWW